MESDYVEFDYVDLLSLKDVVVKKEQATTYINIDGPKKPIQNLWKLDLWFKMERQQLDHSIARFSKSKILRWRRWRLDSLDLTARVCASLVITMLKTFNDYFINGPLVVSR